MEKIFLFIVILDYFKESISLLVVLTNIHYQEF